MFKLQETDMIARSRTQKGLGWGMECLFFFAVFGISQTVSSIPTVIATVAWVVSKTMAGTPTTDLLAAVTNMPDWLLLVTLFSTALATLTVILFCVFIQKRDLPSIGFRKKGAVREYLLGALIGTVLFSAAVGICAMFGAVEISLSSCSPLLWILFLLGYFLQGMSEEVLCRGYFMPSVARRNSLALAVFLNSILFSLLHLFNTGISPIALLNIALVGILLSIYVLRRGDLWGACAIHSLWNFVQGNVFGVRVSGISQSTSILSTVSKPSLSLLNGGDFGLEGGLAVTIVLALAIVIVFVLRPRGVAPSPTKETF